MKLEEVNLKTREVVNYLVQSLEAGQSAVLTQYLGAMAKFRNYSFGNIMLSARQKPDATHVAGLRTWNSLGRFVRRGEKGIFILAPMVGNKRNKEENAEQNTDAKETHRTLYGFRGVYVFDITQTEGKEGVQSSRSISEQWPSSATTASATSCSLRGRSRTLIASRR